MARDVGAGRVQYVDVGRYRLALEDAGTGSPTVVLEVGAGLSRATWDAVWAPVAELTCVLRYDRAGWAQVRPLPRPAPLRSWLPICTGFSSRPASLAPTSLSAIPSTAC
jgi:hypothetical protein